MHGIDLPATNFRWTDCDETTDRTEWSAPVRRFFDYWLSIAPLGCLPGRQHFDPLDIYDLMSRIWILDVVREEGRLRFRYRLAGTKEVETLKREVTGQWLDDVHPHLREEAGAFARYEAMVQTGRATYRKGPVNFVHDPDHRMIENCMAPMARDGTAVDMIASCSAAFYRDGRLVL